MAQNKGFPTFVRQALEKESRIKFRIDWMGKGKLIAYGVTWAAPQNYDSLSSFASMVKKEFGVTDKDYVSGGLRGDNYKLKNGGILAFYGSMGELDVELVK